MPPYIYQFAPQSVGRFVYFFFFKILTLGGMISMTFSIEDFINLPTFFLTYIKHM
jgi:hypothetical protein